ncbi:MAG: hypothetical protein ABI605_15840 [Rhizobacter sp.]
MKTPPDDIDSEASAHAWRRQFLKQLAAMVAGTSALSACGGHADEPPSGKAPAPAPAPAGGANLKLSGTVAHRSVVTITDSLARFGTRTNVKPLYVAFGDQRAGSALGRRTGDYYNIGALASNAKTVGAITQTYRYDFKGTETENAIWGNEIFFTEDATRPLLQYMERYYDFDIYQAKYQKGGQFNLKTNRLWGNWNINPSVCDLYVGYNGSWGPMGAVAAEHTPESPSWMDNTDVPAFQWMSEEYVFQNSSAPDRPDGFMEFYRNNKLQNTVRTQFITHTSANPLPLTMVFFDQVSNGSGDGVSNIFEYLGYINLDDEYRRVYLSDSPTRAPGSKLIPMIQTAWSPASLSIQLVNSQLPFSGNYLHIRLGKDTWLEAIPMPAA